ncbi:RHS repeat domain-containing protein [Chryseobacterium taklimakanense]|uniref:RHS repeat-associated core domain-containing protein n=1 Tax=Chryseobacterium taklimakanense TaxID=536441 RepID=A0A3G8WHI4_9FLAO|nr:RHS repeat-associated core domain-containing protein [Chryseobacterium taklimakanense]AZI20635.1 hypothetical protein EIH08_07845 [Chryseobacterium taklimakanense]
MTRNNQTGEEKHILYIGGSPYESNIIFVKNYTESSGSYKFLHKDYLGSILAISDEAGNKIEQRHFDAWGNLTHLQVNGGAIMTDDNQIRDFMSNGGLLLDRGYTSHEHFAEVGLIHMNGRLYDPLLRRFLNADENIQDMFNTQNYNKYGYVLNNPLMFNDPSGEFFIFGFLAGMAVKWVAGMITAAIIGAVAGLVSYSLSVWISGDKWKLGAALKSTFWGAVGGAVSFGVGSIFVNGAGAATAIAETLGKFGSAIVQGGVHAISQGVLSVFQGGNFLTGAVGGAFGSWAASGFGAVAKDFASKGVSQILFGAVAGGVGTKLTGGNFWEGVLIGGIVAGLNHAMHSMGNENSYEDGNEGGEDPPGKGKTSNGRRYFMGDKFENAQFQKDIQAGLIDPAITYESFMWYADKGLAFASSLYPSGRILGFLEGRALTVGEYTITKTVANNLATRPYINSPSTIKSIMSVSKGVKDLSFKGGMNYKAYGTFNGSRGIFELGINPRTNTIYHFVFKSFKP